MGSKLARSWERGTRGGRGLPGALPAVGSPRRRAPRSVTRHLLGLLPVLAGPVLGAPGTLVTAIEAPRAIARDAVPRAQDEGDGAPFTKLVRRLMKAYDDEDWSGMRRDFTQAFSYAFPATATTPIFQKARRDRGRTKSLEPPRIRATNHAVIRVHCERGDLDVEIVIDEAGRIDGLRLLPVTEGILEHRTRLRLPVRGAWTVLWGGDTPEQNHHVAVPNQRYAVDLLVLDEKQLSHEGDGSRNEDYFAFGRDVVAPADGDVIEVWRGVRDNPPGSPNPDAPFGNAVFLRHREGEISVLAHLRQGSLRVAVGDHVARGHVLASCGNSGNSTEPHLHYHLQNAVLPQAARGIRPTFEHVVRILGGREERVDRCHPVRGETLRQVEDAGESEGDGGHEHSGE